MTYCELMVKYLESLKGKATYERTFRVANQWILQQTETPTRALIIERHRAKGGGDCQPGCQQANKELAIQRAAFRWGLYHEIWDGGDPTVGIRKWKTKHRKRVAKFLEVRAVLDFFDFAKSDRDIRNRALFGIVLLTGCRPSEVRMARVADITPYGDGGCWKKWTTKTGEEQEIPVPRQAMEWLAAWMQVRESRSPWIFPGQSDTAPIDDDTVRMNWSLIREELRIAGLWTYDLRRTLASYMSNELGQSDKRIQAILNHHDGRALSHYCHVSFDAMAEALQGYADWLFTLQGGDYVPTTHPIRAPRHGLRAVAERN